VARSPCGRFGHAPSGRKCHQRPRHCHSFVGRGWTPRAIGLATAGFSNGILIGEIIPVALTASVVLPLVGHAWQPSLAVWSIPVVLTALAIFLFSENEPPEVDRPPARWWPDWRDRRVWLIGLTLGGASASYWGANAFLPELLRHGGHGGYTTATLTSLNVAQLPASLAVAALPGRLVARTWSLSVAGMTTIAGGCGVLLLPPAGLIVAAGVLGLSSAWVFVLALALPPLVSEPGDTHRVSAGVFTISYTCPFLGALLGGGLWDLTGVPQTAFLTVIAGGLMMLVSPLRLDLAHARERLVGTEATPLIAESM
jgi:CP family cyanate transporter-like MFS transporter